VHRKRHSEEWKRKMSEAKKGKPFSGRAFGSNGEKHTEETKKKMSLLKMGKPRPDLKGHPLTQATKEKIRNLHLGKKHSKETRMKMSVSHKKLVETGKHPSWKGGLTAKKFS